MDLVAHACNPRIREAEAGGEPQFPEQPKLEWIASSRLSRNKITS